MSDPETDADVDGEAKPSSERPPIRRPPLLFGQTAPLIDRLVRPRRYGRLRTGAPLPLAPKEDGR